MAEPAAENAEALAKLLIRNFNDFPDEREARPPLYDSVCARLARGTAARKLGASIDTVAPGMRSCPYHLHHAQEEMFIVIEGRGTLRVAGELLPLRAGDIAFIRREVLRRDPAHGQHRRLLGRRAVSSVFIA